MPYHLALARWDPAVFDAYNNWYEMAVLSHSGQHRLDSRTRELVIVAVCAAIGDTKAVEIHARKALRIGARAEHLVDVAVLAGAVRGIPTMRDAIEAIARVTRQ